MSAIRNSLTRRLSRNHHASPYSRPTTRSASSSWSLSSLFSFLNPLSSFVSSSSSDDSPNDDVEESTDESHGNPNFMYTPLLVPAPAPAPAPTTPTIVIPPPVEGAPTIIIDDETPTTDAGHLDAFGTTPNNSPSKHQEAVTQYLLGKEKEGTTLNSVEVEGLISMLKKASDGEVEPEPFRFSTTPSTPTRSPQPPNATSSSIFSFSPTHSDRGKLSASTSLPTFTNNSTTSSSSPRKMLSRNPNGEYRWVGGGSARRGGPSRTNSPKASTPSPRQDNKRRRVGADKDSSTAESSGGLTSSHTVPSMGPATNGINGTSATPSTPTPNARAQARFPRPLRASLNPKTAPARPSPLRQSYAPGTPSPSSSAPSSPGSPSSRASGVSPSAARTSTHAADVLNEIIEKVTPPPRHADVSNPYQTASPVKPKPATKPREKRKMPERKAKAQASEANQEKLNAKESEKEKEVPSPQAIIEATVPKGAKRTRPPATFNRSTTSQTSTSSDFDLRRNGRLQTPEPESQVEEPEDDADKVRVAKKTKRNTVTVEEIEDDDSMDSTPTVYRPTEVIEPGDKPLNRKSTIVFDAPAIGTSNGELNGGTIFSSGAGSKSNPSPVFGMSKSSAPKEPSKLRTSFIAQEPEDDASVNIKDDVKMADPTNTSAPSNTRPPFFGQVNGFTPQTKAESQPPLQTTPVKRDAKAAALALDAASLPVYVFDFPSGPLTNINNTPMHATAKAKAAKVPIAELPKFDLSNPAPAVRSFDWAAAGAKSPANGAAWKCSTCDLQASATAEKCTVCDAPRPAAAAASAPARKAFDWAAAGMKPMNGAAAGSLWTCGTCALQNPASATEKCTICDAPRK